MSIKRLYLVSLFILLLSGLGFSQTAERSEIIKWQNGHKFYLHTVTKGQGLYAIKRLYNVEEKDILENNPEAFDGLKEGQTLLIPFKKPSPLPYRIHQIKANETVYSISKLYKISQELIFEMNPEVKNGYKINQKLKIPLEKDIIPITVEPKDNAKKYKVRRKDTLFALSKKFGCSEEDILTLNPEIKEHGLKKGQKIIIPKREVVIEEALYVPVDSMYYEEDFLRRKPVACDSAIQRFSPMPVALLLPFDLDKRAFEIELEAPKGKTPQFKAKPFLEFYQGTLLALKQLKKEGYKIDLHVFNTLKDSLPISNLLNKAIFKQVELIIGPVYADNFATVQAFADSMQIPIINPIIRGNNKAEHSQYTIDVFPDKATEMDQEVRFVMQNDSSEILLIHSGYLDDKILLNDFKKKYNKALYWRTKDSSLLEKPNLNQDSLSLLNKTEQTIIRTDTCPNCKELVYPDSKTIDLSSDLNPNKNNLIIICSDNQAFVSNIFSKLNILCPQFSIQVLAREKWRKFDNINIEYLHKLNVMQLTSESINYEQWGVKKIVNDSRNYFHSEASKYTFYAYDLFYNFTKYFYRWNAFNCISNFRFTGYIFGYHLVKTSKGWQNKSLFIEHYQPNFEVKKKYQLTNSILTF